MTLALRGCFASLSILLSVATIASQAVAQSAQGPVSPSDDKWAALAAPYVVAALTQPVDQLYATAMKREPYDMMTFGLALLAGRPTDGDFSEDDRAAILRLEERVAPLTEAYQIKAPDRNILRVNWRRKLKITEAEWGAVDRYQSAYLPDYWLAEATAAIKTTFITKNYRPTTSDIGRGMAPGMSTSSDVYYDRIIPLEVIFTGAHCMAAVRKEAGLSLQLLHDHPISVLVVRSYNGFDIETGVADQIRAGKGKGPVGKAACGTAEEFNAYVAMLKASTAQ